MREALLQVRSLGVSFYVLRDERGLYLIDGGFVGGRGFLERALRKKGWDAEPILGIVITHGHLDHILNIAKIAEDSGAWIAAPSQDLPHYQGSAEYQGAARVTGCLEAVARPLLGFSSFAPTRLLDEGDVLDIWQGLKVVSLPGHTEGHIGLYCAKLKILFSGDLFASFGRFSHWPPRFFNVNSRQVRESARKALDLDLDGVLPNHGDGATPADHLKRLRALSNGRN